LMKRVDLLKKVTASVALFDSTTTNVLGPVQRKFLGAHKTRKMVRDDDGYEFSDEAFVNVAAKDFRYLYHDRDTKKSIKGTAVTLLLDLSGSMAYGPSSLFGEATNAAASSIWSVWAMAQILRCPFEILGYSTCDVAPGVMREAAEEFGKNRFAPYRRTEGVVTHVIKSFDEKWGQQHKNALVALLGFLGGDYLRYVPSKLKVPALAAIQGGDLQNIWSGNVDGENLMLARQRMVRRPEQRKVIIVVSDGNPVSCYAPEMAAKNHLRYEIKRTVQKGIKVIGVGIGRDGRYVKDFYPMFRHLPDPAGLGKALIEML